MRHISVKCYWEYKDPQGLTINSNNAWQYGARFCTILNVLNYFFLLLLIQMHVHPAILQNMNYLCNFKIQFKDSERERAKRIHGIHMTM